MRYNLSFGDYTKILETGEFSDTEILVGKEPKTKLYRLHSLVLKVRSPYFRTAFSNGWVKIENILKKIFPVGLWEITYIGIRNGGIIV